MEALSPTRCAGCERPGVLVCDICLNELSLIDPITSCIRCGAPFGDTLCTECHGEDLGADRVLAMAGYEGPLPRIIRAYKDAGERRLAHIFAEMLADTAEHAERVAPQRFAGFLSAADVLVPVPNTAAAYKRRGFDHMVTIAQKLDNLVDASLLDCLVKADTRDQRSMGRTGRFLAQIGAYQVLSSAQDQLKDARVILIDDVITTGSTVREVASVLAQAGVAHIDVLALARVW